MDRPLVTIGLSTYNRANGYLRESLGSAVAQTYRPLEIVVSDNHSGDDTPGLVSEMGDDRVRYFRQEANIGPNPNFNFCLEQARGEYFLLLHDDDMIDPDMVDACIEGLASWQHDQRPGLIRTGTRVVDADGQLRTQRVNRARNGDASDLILDWFDYATSLYLCSSLFHTDTLRGVGGFKSGNNLYQDVIAEVRVAAQRPTLNVPAIKASFRRHGENLGTANNIKAWCDDSLQLLDEMCAAAPRAADEIRRRGLLYFSNNNYSRAARFDSAWERIQGYWIVYRSFGFRRSPVSFVAYRAYTRLKRALAGS